MAKTWNPKAPPVLGFEWLLTGGADSTIQAYSARDLRMESTQAETVTGFGLPIKDVGASDLRPGTFVEVFDEGNQHINGPITTEVYAPTADVVAKSSIGGTAWRGMPGSDTTDLWAYIDEPVVWPPPGGLVSYIDYRQAAGGGYVFQVGSGAFPLTERITFMRVHTVLAAVHYSGVYTNRHFAIRLQRLSDDAMRTPINGGSLFATAFSTEFTINLGEVNPWEDRPWTPADVQEFAPGGDYAIRVEAGGTTDVAAAVLSIALEVDHMVENRLAVGMWRRPASQASGNVATTSLITLPGGAANWSKAGAPASHVYRWRIARDHFVANPTTSTVQWRTAFQQLYSQAGEPGPYNVRGQTVDLGEGGTTAAVGPDSFAPAINLTVAGSPSSDSQPFYVEPSESAGTLQVTPLTSIEQRFTPGSTQAYLPFRYLVRPALSTIPADAQLTLTIRRVSDGVQMGGSHVVTAANIADYALTAAGAWRIIADRLSAGTGSLVSGTQYAFRWTVTGGSMTWLLARVSTSTGGNPSFGGTANSVAFRAEPGGATTPFASVETPAVLLQQPSPISSATAKVAASPTRLGVDCFCNVPTIEHVMLAWVGVVVSGFVRIEIERYLDTGHPETDAWHLVARKLSNPVTQDAKWTDRTVPRGTPAKYRLRYIDSNESFSEWTYTQFARPEAHGAEVIFTSNHVPDITVAYDHEPSLGYDLLDFDGDVLLPIDGADYQLAFVQTEVRGVAPRMKVIANFGRQPCDDLGRPIGKQRIFAPLIRAARAEGMPYVVVLDSDGNRSLAHVSLSGATSDQPAHRYYVTATITPLAGEPIPVDVP